MARIASPCLGDARDCESSFTPPASVKDGRCGGEAPYAAASRRSGKPGRRLFVWASLGSADSASLRAACTAGRRWPLAASRAAVGRCIELARASLGSADSASLRAACTAARRWPLAASRVAVGRCIELAGASLACASLRAASRCARWAVGGIRAALGRKVEAATISGALVRSDQHSRIDQHAGVQHAARIERGLGCAQRARE